MTAIMPGRTVQVEIVMTDTATGERHTVTYDAAVDVDLTAVPVADTVAPGYVPGYAAGEASHLLVTLALRAARGDDGTFGGGSITRGHQ